MREITVSHPADLTPYQSGLLFTALDDEETDARTPWISTRETSHGPFHDPARDSPEHIGEADILVEQRQGAELVKLSGDRPGFPGC